MIKASSMQTRPHDVDASIAMDMAVRAAALCVTRSGAADAIPSRREVEAFRPLSGTTRR